MSQQPPERSGDLTSASAGRLAGLLAQREVSACEVVEAHLRRISEVDAALNAVVQLDGERALARAREADAALARGRLWGPLHGVPFTVKDNFRTAGIAMALGVPERVGIVAGTDATAVARVKDERPWRAPARPSSRPRLPPADTSSRSRSGARTPAP